jgi:hypothetical protein
MINYDARLGQSWNAPATVELAGANRSVDTGL